MALILTTHGEPVTPVAGVVAIWPDSARKQQLTKDEGGFIRSMSLPPNFSVAAQTPAAGVRTYIVGSAIAIPPGKLRIGTMLKWVFDMTKTAAGTAASTIDICVGTTGTVADTARVSFTKPAGTAAIDNADVVIDAICRGPLSTLGVFAGGLVLTHNLAATGHALIPCVNVTTISAGFDITVPNLIVGLCITTGAADAITIQIVKAEAVNL